MTIVHSIYLMALVLINLVTLVLFLVDKQAASARRSRIPERTLLALLLLGGVIGGSIGIFVIRHKSQHHSFRIVLVIAFVLHMALAVWLLAHASSPPGF